MAIIYNQVITRQYGSPAEAGGRNKQIQANKYAVFAGPKRAAFYACEKRNIIKLYLYTINNKYLNIG